MARGTAHCMKNNNDKVIKLRAPRSPDRALPPPVESVFDSATRAAGSIRLYQRLALAWPNARPVLLRLACYLSLIVPADDGSPLVHACFSNGAAVLRDRPWGSLDGSGRDADVLYEFFRALLRPIPSILRHEIYSGPAGNESIWDPMEGEPVTHWWMRHGKHPLVRRRDEDDSPMPRLEPATVRLSIGSRLFTSKDIDLIGGDVRRLIE